MEEEVLLRIKEQLDNLQKENRLRMINDILFSVYEVVGTIKTTIDFLKMDDIEYTITDEMMGEIIARVKYDLNTLERYL